MRFSVSTAAQAMVDRGEAPDYHTACQILNKRSSESKRKKKERRQSMKVHQDRKDFHRESVQANRYWDN